MVRVHPGAPLFESPAGRRHPGAMPRYHASIVSEGFLLLRRSFAWVVLCLLLLAGCGGGDASHGSEVSDRTDVSDRSEPSGKSERPAAYNPARRTQLADLPVAEVRIGEQVMPVWIAANSLTREEGMMHLTDAEVPDDHGMLFVFLEEAPLSFWMRNTLIPLDIAFLDAKGEVLNTERMQPRDPTPIPSKGPAKYALEAKAGTFKRLGLRPGMTIKLPAGLSAID
ncbi:MAG: hypothetical protein AMXMBFR61_26670 [Fimbriimonadales bacterium]